MQGQNSPIGSFPESLTLEHDSNSSDSRVVDQQIRWSNIIQSPSIVANQETRNLTMWTMGESSSTTVPNHACQNRVDPKIANGWSTVVKPHLEPHQHEPLASRLSLGGVNLNTTHTHANIHHQHHHYHGHNVTVNPSTIISMKPANSASSSSGPNETNPRHLPCKRKTVDLDIGQSSSGLQSSNILQEGILGIPAQTNTMPFDPNNSINPIIPGQSSSGLESSNIGRNVRFRISNSRQRQQDQLSASNNININNNNNGLLSFSSPYTSLGLNSVPTTGDSSSTRVGQPILRVPTLTRNLHSSSRNRSSSSTANRPVSTSIVSGPTSNPTPNLGPHHGSSVLPTRRNVETLRRALLSSVESGTGGGGQNSNLFSRIPPPVGASTSSSQESGTPRVIGIAGYHPHHHLPHAITTSDQQLDGVFGLPYRVRTAAGGSERRGRLMSEMRNVLDLLRRGEGLRFEDVMILEQSVFYGMADIHDRHRDMRLDIDNMSYEELLALEERIGNVNTGLTEENVHKYLKPKTYASVTGQTDDEPCCICQEEYKNGDDLGALECGHGFHANCIKQWLLQKNSCPICKSSASK